MKRGSALAASAAASASLVAGCGSSNDVLVADPQRAAPSGGKLIVFAAASLKKSFTEIGEQFKTDNPGSDVEFNFAGSSDLVTQLTQGARPTSSPPPTPRTWTRPRRPDLLAGDPVNFASNTLTIVTAPGNPKKVASFKDLTKPGLDVVVCAPQVPCGSATEKVEKATGVQLNPVSEESSVTDVLEQGDHRRGRRRAGVRHRCAGRGRQGHRGAVPRVRRRPSTPTRSRSSSSPRTPELARKFVDLVTGEAGQKVLSAAGFAKP